MLGTLLLYKTGSTERENTRNITAWRGEGQPFVRLHLQVNFIDSFHRGEKGAKRKEIAASGMGGLFVGRLLV